LRVLPDGCTDLVWEGQKLLVSAANPAYRRHAIGPDTANAGIRLMPGFAGAVLGCVISELPPLIDVAAIWGREARSAQALLSRPGSAAQLRLALEHIIQTRLTAGRGPDPVVMEAIERLRLRPSREPDGDGSVDALARHLGLSARQLQRRFQVHVGLGPKGLQRVLRFYGFVQRIPEIGVGHASLAAVAAGLGYADQSHLGRECRDLSGSSPTELIATGTSETF
jgi:AraC-like DNA-binding protein